MTSNSDLEKIITHIKNSGYVYPGSQIYGGLANTWDYGPLGVELKNNIKKAWWRRFVYEKENNVGLDSAILMNSKVWEASGHLDTFHDPLMDCKSCKTRHRADHLIENFDQDIEVSKMSNEEMEEFISENKITCPKCEQNNFSKIRHFNMMFKTHQGVIESEKNEVYLRPETAQGIFVNFKNILRTSRKKIPFGIAQTGKAFRNEITPGNFIFRTREFEQMELEFFSSPNEGGGWYNFFKKESFDFLLDLNIKEENLRLRDHPKEELSFYSSGTCDIEYKFGFGWGELWGIANRTDYDLKKHQKHSGENMEYLDPYSNEKYIPHCIEPSLGVDRLFFAILQDAYKVEPLEKGEERIVLNLHPFLAPFKVCVMPLSKKLSEKAKSVYKTICKEFNVEYDESGSIGKRYRRQDAIGTPFCVTIDFETNGDESVTIRDRDSMIQERIKIKDLKSYLGNKIDF